MLRVRKLMFFLCLDECKCDICRSFGALEWDEHHHIDRTVGQTSMISTDPLITAFFENLSTVELLYSLFFEHVHPYRSG